MISVIITTYNRGNKTLLRAVDSVLQQRTSYPYEILVIDDNGINTEAQITTNHVLKEYISKQLINYFPLPSNSGACLARNFGITQSKGDFIFFLDDDDEFLDIKLQTQVQWLLDNPNFAGCLASFIRKGLNGKEIFANSNFPSVGDFVSFSIRGNFFTPMLCIRKKSLIEIGGFYNIDRYQDRYFMLHALKKNHKFYCLKEPLHIMYEHEGERISNLSIHKTIDSLNKIYRFVKESKVLFSKDEWVAFEVNNLTMLATPYYLSSKLIHRLKGGGNFCRIFLKKPNIKNALNCIKSILNLFRTR